MEMKYGVLVDGEFEERELINMEAKGFSHPLMGRVDTYDHYVMKEIFRSYGKLEVEGKIVLDIGANIGCFSAWALLNKAKHVIALEPEVNNFNMLQLNTSPFGIQLPEEPYTLHNAALHSLTDGDSELWLSTTGKNPGNSSTTHRRGRVSVPIKLMSVAQLREYHPHIDAAKIDCEGAEYEFIRCFIPGFPMLKQVALELHMSGFGLEQAEELHDFMMSQGFIAKVPPRIEPNLWQTLATYVRD